jgi:hypothetical protein
MISMAKVKKFDSKKVLFKRTAGGVRTGIFYTHSGVLNDYIIA